MIGLALNIWHVVMVTQELGLDHAFAAGFDYEYLQRKLKIESDIRGTTYDMMPVCFLCIGYGLEDKGDAGGEDVGANPFEIILNQLSASLIYKYELA